MKTSLSRALLFLGPFVLLVFLYWRCLHGEAIWDDVTYWFQDPLMTKDFSYLKIWSDFAWPLTVSVQKILFSWWGHDYLYYHLLNLGLHFVNSLLVYRLSRSYLVFFLFLIHPAAVISVGWMIQLKTVLCLFFALLSFLAFDKGLHRRPWILASLCFFFLSVTAKSASLFLPLIFLGFAWKKMSRKELLFVLPFFLISAWSGHKIVSSPVTSEAVEKIQTKTEMPRTSAPEAPKTVPEEKSETSKWRPDLELTLKTLRYYFWQSLLPWDNQPVKGLNLEPVSFKDYLHLLFLLGLVFFTWKKEEIWFLASGHVMLLPFLGLIPAPYMTVSWVSDQHLYLALPVLLMFWVKLFSRLPKKGFQGLALVLAAFFSFKTYGASLYYKDPLEFFEASLEANPRNVPVSYNLAVTLLFYGEFKYSHYVLKQTILRAQEDPQMKQNTFFPQVEKLYQEVKDIPEAQFED